MIGRGADNRQAEGHVHPFVEMQCLERDQRLVVIHAQGRVVAGASFGVEHGVGGHRSGHLPALGTKRVDRRLDQLDLLAAERAAFAGMGIERRHREARLGDPEIALQAAQGGTAARFDQVGAKRGGDGAERDMGGDGDGAKGWAGEHHRDIAGPTLRTVPVTTHLPLMEVGANLTSALIESRGRTVLRGLQRNFGITEPRLAISGFNPHSGEGGLLGTEEEQIIRPAIAALAAEGWRVTGPHPADTMFHPRARAKYDAALCMYHDQALIPIKAVHFDEAVNVTLGLPIVRTAPDHGTAFDIAGQDRADPRNFAAAIRMAADCAALRADAA